MYIEGKLKGITWDVGRALLVDSSVHLTDLIWLKVVGGV